MTFPYFDGFHNLTKNRRTSHIGTKHSDDVEVKVYERYPIVTLPDPLTSLPPLDSVIQKRESARSTGRTCITTEKLSTILYYAAAILDENALDARGRRPLASAGAKFPLEVYLLTFPEQTAIPQGVHHYRPDQHNLEHIYAFDPTEDMVSNLFQEESAKHFQLAIFITAVFARTTTKYAERGYRYILMEAGAMGQALQNTGVAVGVDSLICGGTFDEEVERLLALDGVTESLLLTVLLK